MEVQHVHFLKSSPSLTWIHTYSQFFMGSFHKMFFPGSFFLCAAAAHWLTVSSDLCTAKGFSPGGYWAPAAGIPSSHTIALEKKVQPDVKDQQKGD